MGCGKAAADPGATGGSGGNPAETIVECTPAVLNAGGEGGGASIPSSFQWSSSDPLLVPKPDKVHPILSLKDPSIVRFEDKWHVFATTANEMGQWSMVYVSFADWSEAPAAEQHHLGDVPTLRGYHAAPQVFFFAPHDKWYLIFQSGQPQYTTNDDITNFEGWATPTNFFATEPQIVRDNKGMGTWLDFFVICDETRCHLFFTDDNGNLYRSETALDSFPQGFADPVIAVKGTKETLFEGSSHYRVDETGQYLTLVEAFSPNGRRFYRSLVSDTLDGEWSPLADDWDNPFAASVNVTFQSGTEWTRDISHGELLRSNYDQTPSVSMSCLRFLFQGVDPKQIPNEYYEYEYRLGLLTLSE